jgi:hypothetical protein
VKEAVEGLAGGVGRFTQSWFLPSLIAVGLVAFFLFPAVRHRGIFVDIASLGAGEVVALVTLIAVILAVLLASVATPLYRVLEGYTLPSWFKEWRKRHHQQRWQQLCAQVDDATTDDDIGIAVLRERLDRYPRSGMGIMPTRLGNILRSGESYGPDQYGLDTVLLWNHLMAVAKDELKEDLTNTRTLMDFYTGVCWLGPVFAGASAFAALYGSSPIHYWGLAAVLLCPLAYEGAVRAATSYASSLRALVDMTRRELAQQLGLSLPTNLKAEKELWEAVSQFFAWGRHWPDSERWVSTVEEARVDEGKGTSGRS